MNEPNLTPLMQALMPKSPRFWARYTLAPKWALLPGGMVDWRAVRNSNQIGDPTSKPKPPSFIHLT